MSRELPRKVRKELEIAIEKIIGPVEETLKNQLENIIRNCQERLSREYLRDKDSDVPLSSGTQRAVEGSNQQDRIAGTSHVNTGIHPVNRPIIPPEGTALGPLPDSLDWHAWSSSEYNDMMIPNLSDADIVLPSDPWWSLDVNESLIDSSSSMPLFDGKGKGRANLEKEFGK